MNTPIEQKIPSINRNHFKEKKNVKNIFTLESNCDVYFIEKQWKSDNSLKVMQSLVNGYIERYPNQVRLKFHIRPYEDTIQEYFTDCEIIVNEEGLLNGEPVNSLIYEMFGIKVCGTAILLEGGLK